jgi:hypothetical protein
MTEKEILQQQEVNEQKAFYLIAVGMFYHAYGNGAFALARATGYRVLRKHRKHGDILTCGFPANQLDMVLQRIREAGSEVEQTAEKTFLFRGLDGTPDENMISEQKPQTVTSPTKDVPQSEAPFSWLVDELLSFNLCRSITYGNHGFDFAVVPPSFPEQYRRVVL